MVAVPVPLIVINSMSINATSSNETAGTASGRCTPRSVHYMHVYPPIRFRFRFVFMPMPVRTGCPPRNIAALCVTATLTPATTPCRTGVTRASPGSSAGREYVGDVGAWCACLRLRLFLVLLWGDIWVSILVLGLDLTGHGSRNGGFPPFETVLVGLAARTGCSHV